MTEPIDISIIIPAYNEAKRLPHFLESVVDHCVQSKERYEIIVVDDGSTDGTPQAVQPFQSIFPRLKILVNERNSGKGYSVKRGMFEAQGNIRVFLDADGSTHPSQITRNQHYFDEGADIVIGSRVLTAEGLDLDVRWYRKYIGTVFNYFVRTFLFDDIKDTQCGFKMFRAEAVNRLFSRTYLNGFGFDIELLYLAHKMGYTIVEEPVAWHHVPESKVNMLFDSLKMFFNILQVRNWHCTPINRQSAHMGPDEYRFMYDLEEKHWWFTSRRDLVRRILERLNLNEPNILDVGAGTGANMHMFATFGHTTGVDGSPQAVDYCRKRGLERVVCSSIEQMEFPQGAFDVIACMDVLEHIDEPVKALKEIARVLDDQGVLIITVPAFKLLWSQHDEALCHRRRYGKKSLIHDLRQAGFYAEKISYLYFIPFFAVAPIRFVRRFWASKDKAYSDTTTLPPGFLNAAFKLILKLETIITLKWGLPFGTSLYAIVRKQNS